MCVETPQQILFNRVLTSKEKYIARKCCLSDFRVCALNGNEHWTDYVSVTNACARVVQPHLELCYVSSDIRLATFRPILFNVMCQYHGPLQFA